MARRAQHPGYHPTVPPVARVEAVTSVFEEPAVEPRLLDPDHLRTDPEGIPIPEVEDPKGALALAFGLVIAVRQVPKDAADDRILSDGIATVLKGLARVHPGAAMYAIDAARDAFKIDTRDSTPDFTGMDLFIPMYITLCRDPHFGELIDQRSEIQSASSQMFLALRGTGMGHWESLGYVADAFGPVMAIREWERFSPDPKSPWERFKALSGLALGGPHLANGLLQRLLRGKSLKGLDLEGMTWITSLPAGLSVNNNLRLNGCSGLRELPEGLTVAGHLNLSDCASLRSLPDRLRVGGDLKIVGCHSLCKVGSNIRVDGNLTLAHCRRLPAPPQSLSVGGRIEVGDNSPPGWEREESK